MGAPDDERRSREEGTDMWLILLWLLGVPLSLLVILFLLGVGH